MEAEEHKRKIANLCRFCGSSRLQLINFINISFVKIVGTVTRSPENLVGAAISVKKQNAKNKNHCRH